MSNAYEAPEFVVLNMNQCDVICNSQDNDVKFPGTADSGNGEGNPWLPYE